MRRRSLCRLILGLWLIGVQGSAGPLTGAGLLQSVDLKALPGGGWSALQVSPDGLRLVMMTDKGGFLRLTVERDAEGRITGLRPGKLQRILDTDGKPLRDGQTDTEGLAMAPDGRAWISTEGTARVLAYDEMGGTARRMPRPKAFALFPGNTGFEAIARAPDGQLYLIPEAPLRPKDPFPVYLWSGKDWRQGLTLPHDAGWLAADAAFDPQGRLYLLERMFAGPAGFASRIRRFDLSTGAVRQVMRSGLGQHDNLEGLAIWRDAAGLRATLVSDDNFLGIFRSEIVEYRLPD